MMSLGLMVYLVARKIPEISDAMPQEAEQQTGLWVRIELMLGKLPLDKFDFIISQFFEKNIRKAKLFLATLDNYLTHHLEQFKKVKHRAHRKQEKKFALFEEASELAEGRGEQSGQDAEMQAANRAVDFDDAKVADSAKRVENTK